VSGPTPGEEGDVLTTGTPQFRWLERGEGEAVVLLHGLMGEMDHWEATLEALGDLHRPIAPMLPIFDPALTETSIPALARHVLTLLDALEIPRAVVGGNSLGGHVAIELALGSPQRVSGLILTGSSGLFERSFTRHVPHAPTAEYVRAKMQEVVYDPALVTPSWVEAIRGLLTTRATAMRVLRFARAARHHSFESELPRLAVPTLLVWGKDDRITPPEVAERFHALIPRSELVFLPNCGHTAMLEQPQAFADVVAQWLQETAPQRRRASRVGDGR
jgi:pimeloyl-ACP methyl ester carboxylesterase